MILVWPRKEYLKCMPFFSTPLTAWSGGSLLKTVLPLDYLLRYGSAVDIVKIRADELRKSDGRRDFQK